MLRTDTSETVQRPVHSLRLRAGWVLARDLVQSRVSRRRRLTRRNREAFYRELWTAAAAGVGAPVRASAAGTLEIALDSGPLEVKGMHCAIDGREALDRAGDKALVYRLLAADGLPVPEHRVFSLADLATARRFLAESPGGCVVKPARNGSAGYGVTTGVRADRDLVRAAVAAAAAGARGAGGGVSTRLRRAFGGLGGVPLLIERQATGREYRLLYLDGALVDALRREPPHVIGDGHRSIGRLLAGANTERLRAGSAQGVVAQDLELDATLAAQGLTVSSVPAPGVVVRVKNAINENAAESNHPARDELCKAVIEQGARAAELVGARLVGIDLITADPGVELSAGGGVVLEVNTTPGLAIHHHGHPGGVDVAGEVLRRLSAPSLAASR